MTSIPYLGTITGELLRFTVQTSPDREIIIISEVPICQPSKVSEFFQIGGHIFLVQISRFWRTKVLRHFLSNQGRNFLPNDLVPQE